MSRACGETIGPRIRTCRFVDASGRRSGSNRPDQHNGSCPSCRSPERVQRPTPSRFPRYAPRSPRRSVSELAGGDCGLNKSRAPQLSFGRNQVPVTIALDLCASITGAAALPADPARGEKLARHWCASCHIVANDQKGGADSAPPFATIARKPQFDGGKIAQFLMDPHPKMPDMQLSRDEAKDLGAYIASLAQ